MSTRKNALLVIVCVGLLPASLFAQGQLGMASLGGSLDTSVFAAPAANVLQPPAAAAPAVGDDYEIIDVDSLPKPWVVGDFKIVPYGAFWADMIYASRRTNPGAYTLFVHSREVEGEGAFTIDARRSRFGLNVTGPRIPMFGCGQSGGKVEIDFHGSFETENKPGVLLRHAYWECKNDYSRVLVGQTWDVVSPGIPNTLNYSIGWLAGNIGYRRTQFRYERYAHLSPGAKGIFQVALAENIVPDFTTVVGVDRESPNFPMIQSRVAFVLGDCGPGSLPIEFGASGHYGETGFDLRVPGPPPLFLPPQDDARFKTWSFNVDVSIPITDRIGFQGEFFTGANLSPLLGGIGQGVCPCLRVPIRSKGGWAEVFVDWDQDLHSAFGAGLDDPDNSDALLGRTYNSFIYGNLVYDITRKLSTGFEVTSWKTKYMERRAPPFDLAPTEPGHSVTLDWMVKYAF